MLRAADQRARRSKAKINLKYALYTGLIANRRMARDRRRRPPGEFGEISLSAALTSIADARETVVQPAPGERLCWPQYRAMMVGILILGIVDAVWLGLSDLRIAFWPAMLRLGVPTVLLLGALFYAISGRSERICATLLAVGTLLMFTLFGVILSYLAIRGGWPMMDDNLAAWDRVLGLDWPAYQRFVGGHPWFAFTTGMLYETSVIQILAVALVLGFSGRLAVLAEFMAGLIISAFIAVVVGALLPALGAYHHFGIPDNGIAFYASAIVAAHDGTLQVLDLGAAEGLVVFPSFHTAISVAVMIACWPVRYLRYPSLVINALLIAGVPVWGGHYFVDVIAGTLIVAFAVSAWRRLWPHAGA